MAMVVQHNLTAMNSNRMLGITMSGQSKSSEKLSSGYKINRAADDAAGLTISEKMRKQIRGLDRASTNAQDGVSAVQTAEGALTEVHSMLQRMNELAVQAANGTHSESDRQAIQDEIDQLTTEIDRVAETTKFNETYLLRGDTTATQRDVFLAAHDAGLNGTLKVTNKTAGQYEFTLKSSLAEGEKINIGGTEYTIAGSGTAGSAASIETEMQAVANKTTYPNATVTVTPPDGSATSATVYKYDKGEAPDNTAVLSLLEDAHKASKAGDKLTTVVSAAKTEYTFKNAVTLVDPTTDLGKLFDASLDTATAATGDVITITRDGKEVGKYTLTSGTAATDKNGNSVTLANAKGVLQAGDTVTVTRADKTSVTIDVAAGTYATGSNTKMGYYTSAGAYTALTALKAAVTDAAGNGFKVGDNTITQGTARTAGWYSAKGDKLDAKSLAIGTKVAVDSDSTDATAATPVTVASSDPSTITKADAVKLITKALETASKVGVDKNPATAVKVTPPTENGDLKWTIQAGTAKVAETLSFNLHVGADADMTNKINVSIDAMSTAGLGVKALEVFGKDEAGKTINDGGKAATYAIDAIADAVAKVSAQRSALGAIQNRLEHTIANLDNIVENTTSAESRIRDTDMAKEMVEYSKNNILAQAGQSMLAQANQNNQGVLSLLR